MESVSLLILLTDAHQLTPRARRPGVLSAWLLTPCETTVQYGVVMKHSAAGPVRPTQVQIWISSLTSLMNLVRSSNLAKPQLFPVLNGNEKYTDCRKLQNSMRWRTLRCKAQWRLLKKWCHVHYVWVHSTSKDWAPMKCRYVEHGGFKGMDPASQSSTGEQVIQGEEGWDPGEWHLNSKRTGRKTSNQGSCACHVINLFIHLPILKGE